MSRDWKLSLVGGLREPGAPGVVDRASLLAVLAERDSKCSPAGLSRITSGLEAEGALEKVSAGLWVNRLRFPPARLDEAASKLRKGAVPSLRSVLGEYGAVNNPSMEVCACVPITSDGPRPALGRETTSGGQRFHFFGLPERFFPGEDPRLCSLFLDPSKPYPSFRPEKALVDWIHLSRSPRSKLPPPPFDLDSSVMDLEILRECSEALVVRVECSSHESLAAFLLLESPAHAPSVSSDSDIKARLRKTRP